jgi:hypothetical protein
MVTRNIFLTVVAFLAAFAFSDVAFAQTSVTTSGSITIMDPVLVVTKNSDLSFGTVYRPTAGNGTVAIDANSGAVTTSGNISVVSGATAATRATFTVQGQASRNVQVTYPQSFTMTRAGGTDTLPVTLTSSMGGGQIGSDGTVAFSMGGQVTLSSTTPSGAYSGNFSVTVTYN